MESRPLRVTVKWAKNLEDLRHVSTMDLSVVVSLSGDTRNQQQETRILQDCGTNACWDQNLSFKVDEAAARAGRLTLKFKIKDHHKLFGHRDAGWVDVSVKELLEKGGRDGKLKVKRCKVKLPSMKTEGDLEFSYKFGGLSSSSSEEGSPPNDGPGHRRRLPVGLAPLLMLGNIVADVCSCGAEYDGGFEDANV